MAKSRPKFDALGIGDVVTVAELATSLGATARTVRNWIAAGQVPSPIRIGNKTFWRKQVLADWFASKEQSSS